MQRTHAVGGGEQVPIVVAEQAYRRAAEALQAAQGGQRFRPTIDQIAQHVDAVARGAEADFVEQAVEGGAAALHVADQVDHRSILLRSSAASAARPAWTLPYCS